MPDQLLDELAINVSEIDTPVFFEGTTFRLGSGPFTQLSFDAQDDETDFSSLSTQVDEAQGAGRQTGQLKDSGGSVLETGVASLTQVITLTDPATGDTVTVGRVKLLVDDQSFGSGEELADFLIFAGPIDPNITYDVTSIDFSPGEASGTSYTYSDVSGGSVQSGGVVCFAAGTLILTGAGWQPVERIQAGTAVQTVDNGIKRVVWAGSITFTARDMALDPRLRPIRIEAGALDNDRPLIVSQQHRIAIGSGLVKAKHLPGIPGFRARLARGMKQVAYHHILLEDHQMLIANGAEAESLFLGSVSNRILDTHRLEFQHLDIADRYTTQHRLCRPMIKKHLLRQQPERLGSAAPVIGHGRLGCAA